MKTDRLVAIIHILSQVQSITAPRLAERLEVSRRTISRDIDALCRAGIPIVTTQGNAGGISVAPGFKVDKALLSHSERDVLRSGLEGLASVTHQGEARSLLWKLAPQTGTVEEEAGILCIDLASHYGDTLPQKLDLLREAAASRRRVAFDYYSDKGVHRRVAEPARLLFRWHDWYLQGYCVQRQTHRLFKLARLWALERLDETFLPRPAPQEKQDYDKFLTPRHTMVLLADPCLRWRLVETYGPDCYTVEPDGRLRLEWGYATPDYMVGEVLRFGGLAEVASPPELREAVAVQVKKLGEIYGINRED